MSAEVNKSPTPGRSDPQRIRDRLAGHHILITGTTGFLAKAFVEKLLRCVDTLAGIHLLVRTRTNGPSAQQRVVREVLGSRAFDRLRASLGSGFERLCDKKIHMYAGDLTEEHLGMSLGDYKSLTERITLVVNSAATVTFDERIDLAIELNTLGPVRLLQFAKDCGDVPMLQVSTCYVCGTRVGSVIEDFTAPESARESLPRLADSGAFDLDGLVESLRGEAKELRHRFGADTEMCRRVLIEAGMSRARQHGWADTYTFTKWIGEQITIRDRGEVPLVIFRPAIIESSYEEPLPGWIDGLRMADPIIVAFGKGKLKEFPGDPDVALDLIPVDLVANAMIATLPVGDAWSDGLSVYHCASSDRNPFLVKDISLSLYRAFRKRPMCDDAGRPIRTGSLRLVDRASFMKRWQSRQRRVARLQSVFKFFGFTGRRLRRLNAIARQIEQLLYFGKIYWPYTHLDCRFVDDAMQAAALKLHPEDRAAYPFDVGGIDWPDYMINRHVPGLRSFVLGSAAQPTPRILAAAAWDPSLAKPAPLPPGGDVFDVFRRAAEQFGEKPFLQIKRGNRWTRYTYDDALQATGTIMRRFLERNLQPGDRVAICGESCPEWGLTYLAAMRAGLTAVPLDPQTPPAEAWLAARFADVKLMCATNATHAALETARSDGDAELVVLEEPFIPLPGASRDDAPDPVSVDREAVASILFTSGTTVSPKAVQLTHNNLLANATALTRVHPVGPADQLLSVLPMYHAFEFTGGFLVPLMCGATITNVEQLKGPEILTAMQATGTTAMLVVPRLLQLFRESIEKQVSASGLATRAVFRIAGWLNALSGHNLGRVLYRPVHKRFGGGLRKFVCGGSRLDPDLYHFFSRMGFEVYEGYGLTETSPVLTVSPSQASRAGSVGPPLPGVELEIRNTNLEGIGEVWARGESVMSGYLHNQEATDKILVDGWLRTGDLGRRDGDGYLFLTGRSTDLIVTSAGKNVYPDDVEARYRDLPYVKELCVFGMTSEDGLGEKVHAVIVLDTSSAAELDRSSVEREIRMAVASTSEGLPTHQRIATLHFWDKELPKTSTMKAKRGVIRECVVGGQLETGSPLTDDTSSEDDGGGFGNAPPYEAANLEIVRRILSQTVQRPPSAIASSLHLHLDLGIDSIGKMDLIGSIESHFDMRIDGEQAASVARVRDLVKLIGDRRPKKGKPRVAGAAAKWLAASGDSAPVNGTIPTPLVPLRWLVRGGVAAFMHTYVRVQAVDRRNIPATGSFILAPNHSSHLDSPSVLTAVGGKRRVWIAGAEDYFFNSAIKRLLFGRLFDTIPFDRKSDGLMGLRRCSEALTRSDGLLMFPEGTRSISGELQPFKIGIALLAMERQVPIVPVYVHRSIDLLPKGQRFVRPGGITVTFGQPIQPPEPDEGSDRSVALRGLAKRVEDAVAALADEAEA